MRNSFSPRLQLDNEGDSGLGGYNGSEGGTGGESAAPVNDFVPRKDFEGVTGKLSNYERELANLKREMSESRSQSQNSNRSEAADPKKPNPKDFDFQKDPDALDKYNDALFQFQLHNYEKTKAEKERPQREAQERQQSLQSITREHNSRLKDYERENPGASDRINKGQFTLYEGLHGLVLDSDFSPAILDYMASHPEAQEELNSVAASAGNAWERSAARYLGRLENKIEAEKTILKNNSTAAGVRVPRSQLKGSVGGNRTATPEDIMKW